SIAEPQGSPCPVAGLTRLHRDSRLSAPSMNASSPKASSAAARQDLVRGLGLWSATAIVIGDTIGTGVFLVTSDMARTVGSAALVFAAWIAGGLIVLC